MLLVNTSFRTWAMQQASNQLKEFQSVSLSLPISCRCTLFRSGRKRLSFAYKSGFFPKTFRLSAFFSIESNVICLGFGVPNFLYMWESIFRSSPSRVFKLPGATAINSHSLFAYEPFAIKRKCSRDSTSPQPTIMSVFQVCVSRTLLSLMSSKHRSRNSMCWRL